MTRLAQRFDSSGRGWPQGLARGELLEQRGEVGRARNAAAWDRLLVAKYAAGATYKRAWLKTWGGEYTADDAWSIVLGPKGTPYGACQGQTKAGIYQGVVAKYTR